MAPLQADEVDRRLEGSRWRREGDAIVRDLEFDGFVEAIAFVDEVAESAEDANHHPDILVHGYNKVRLTLSTDNEGGITGADLDMAATIDALSA
jgi:4a-hydroxytetrahydrobiopterin dehydratase